jgi:hypothetical protein
VDIGIDGRKILKWIIEVVIEDVDWIKLLQDMSGRRT